MAKLPQGSLRYTQTNESERIDCQVLVLDTVGMLSRSYAHGSIAYVGGGMGTSGLHNILEPASEGISVIIGKNYEKYPEAKALVNLGSVVSISAADDCKKTANRTHAKRCVASRKRETKRSICNPKSRGYRKNIIAFKSSLVI